MDILNFDAEIRVNDVEIYGNNGSFINLCFIFMLFLLYSIFILFIKMHPDLNEYALSDDAC